MTHLVEGSHHHLKIQLDVSGLAFCLLGLGLDFINEFLHLGETYRWFQQVAAKIGNIFYELDPLLGDVLARRHQVKELGKLCLSSFYDGVCEWMSGSKAIKDS